ncbi:killer cell lectin-like receptor subfamily I member 1 [Castor canadensis]|uniref:Natural killer cells antigen CD94-like n=1 Tax=Castor canadensis TaxID=51338 RepID=A0A8B7V8K7_CASCN|nr:natural killer cells antigen CD94-like [Castor canadensis]
MPKNKQEEFIVNKEVVTYTEVKFSNSQQKQRISKTVPSPVITTEQQINYVELKFSRTSHHKLRKCLSRENRKETHSTAWGEITGILVVLCVVLMTTVSLLLANLFSRQEEQSRNNSFLPSVSPKNDESSCYISSHNWIGFGNSYYHVSHETKTWEESRNLCMELNSHLVKIETEEELEILSMFEMLGWIFIKWNKTDGSWLWEDSTQVQKSLQKYSKKNHGCLFVDGIYIYPANCSSRKYFICELQI